MLIKRRFITPASFDLLSRQRGKTIGLPGKQLELTIRLYLT